MREAVREMWDDLPEALLCAGAAGMFVSLICVLSALRCGA